MFHFITHFLSDLSSDMSCCSKMELSSDSLMSNHLQISEMLLSHSGFPPVCKEAVLPQRKKKSNSRVYSQLSFTQQDLKLDSPITTLGFVINSLQATLIISLECVHIMSSVLGQCKVSEKRSSLEKYTEYS